MKCKLCLHGEVVDVLNLGSFLPVNLVGDYSEKALKIGICNSCTVVQIADRFTKEINFPSEYPFRSGVTASLRKNFEELVQEILLLRPSGRTVLDIGCNDGTLLKSFHRANFEIFGIEPTGAFAEIDYQAEIFNGFFEDFQSDNLFDVIVLTNTLAHMDNPKMQLVKIRNYLKEDGLLAVEVIDFNAMVERNEFDKFTDEHGFYFTKDNLVNLFESAGFEVVHFKEIETHGGSLRFFCKIATFRTEGISEEFDFISSKSKLDHLGNSQQRIGAQLRAMLSAITTSGDEIYLAGATTRGITLITSSEIDPGIFNAILDVKGSQRIGGIMPNLDLPVIEEDKVYGREEITVLILAWHIKEEIMANMKSRGYIGKFIVPLPEPHLL
jgi:SAM-dependent methyltransferase